MRTGRFRAVLLSALLLALTPTLSSRAQLLDEVILKDFAFREIGPAATTGRITDLELHPNDSATFLVASASGGLHRTVNHGTTFEIIFQNEGTISIGDIAYAPSNPDIIWVGTGEANSQRSSYWGDGVYKSVDGGKTWKNMGLPESHHIGRIVVHPTNPDVVFVAALGHLYTFNEERGLYRTTDGGETWTRVLYVDEKTGVVDVAINPENPDILFAASYERLRRAWDFDGAGPGSAIHRSTDGGTTWERLEGGLPSGNIGRIGLDIYRTNPSIIYATVSNQNSAAPARREGAGEESDELGFDGQLVQGGYRVTAVDAESPAAAAGLRVNDVITSANGDELADFWAVLKAFGKLKEADRAVLNVRRQAESLVISYTLREPPQEGGPMIGGEIYRSDDGGDTWTKMNDRSVSGEPPYYYGQIRVDPNDDQRIYLLGVQLFMSEDGGRNWFRGNFAPTLHVDHHAFVVDPKNSNRLLVGNDGSLGISHDRGQTWDHYGNLNMAQFYAVGVDMSIPYRVYGGTQDNGTWGGPSQSRNPRGATKFEWHRIGGGDGFYAQIDPTDNATVYAESQFGVIYRVNVNTWERSSIRPPQSERNGPRDRFNWNSPILISSHNPQVIYFGGNKLFKSYNRGEDWLIISPDLSTADADKLKGNVPHCTITTIAESVFDPRIILVGTDDGNVQWTHDGGVNWTNHAENFPGLPSHWWVSRVELSRHDRNTAYVSFTGYREDDFRPFVYMTKDGGQSWINITSNLPQEPVNVIREDPRNANVLWVGTELGAFVSVDQGANWTRLKNNLPTIAVHDLVIHPRDRDLVLATHGRGFFIMDVAPLQEWTTEIAGKPAHLFTVEDAYQWQFVSTQGEDGDRVWIAPNPEYGTTISFHLGADYAEGEVQLVIRSLSGDVIRTLDAPRTRGLHRLNWNLRGDAPEADGGNQGRRRRGAPLIAAGEYQVALTVKGETQTQAVHVRRDPISSATGPAMDPETLSGSSEEEHD